MRVDPQLFSLTVSTGSPSSPYFTTLVCSIYRTVTSGSFPRIYLLPTESPSPYLIEPGQRGIFPVFTHSPLTDFPVSPRSPHFTRKPDFDFSLAVNWFSGHSPLSELYAETDSDLSLAVN